MMRIASARGGNTARSSILFNISTWNQPNDNIESKTRLRGRPYESNPLHHLTITKHRIVGNEATSLCENNLVKQVFTMIYITVFLLCSVFVTSIISLSEMLFRTKLNKLTNLIVHFGILKPLRNSYTKSNHFLR